MLTGGSAAATARDSVPLEASDIDNRQVLEFLQLVGELKQVAALLAIEPADGKSRNSPT